MKFSFVEYKQYLLSSLRDISYNIEFIIECIRPYGRYLIALDIDALTVMCVWVYVWLF